jgi:hypothetical protein
LGRVAPSLSLAREVYLDRREDVRLRLEPRGRHSRGSFILPRKLPAERPLNFGGFGVHGGGFSCFICVFVVLLSKSRPALLRNLVVSDPLERASNTRRPGLRYSRPIRRAELKSAGEIRPPPSDGSTGAVAHAPRTCRLPHPNLSVALLVQPVYSRACS